MLACFDVAEKSFFCQEKTASYLWNCPWHVSELMNWWLKCQRQNEILLISLLQSKKVKFGKEAPSDYLMSKRAHAHWFSLGLAGCSAWDLGPAAGAFFLVTVCPRAFVPTTVDIHSCVGNPRVTSQGIAFLLLLCLFGCHIFSLLGKILCDILLFLTCPNNLYRTILI